MEEHTPSYTQLQLTFEEWRNVPGYEDLYQISNTGQVKRIAQRITTKHGYTQTHNAKDKSLGVKNGYYYLWLFKSNQGRKWYVHELVALAFIGPRPKGHDIHHINHNRLDNRPENITYLNKHQHMAYHTRGEQSNVAKLTEDNVRQIRQLFKTKPVHAIAHELNLPYHAVWQVAHHRTWNHVT